MIIVLNGHGLAAQSVERPSQVPVWCNYSESYIPVRGIGVRSHLWMKNNPSHAICGKIAELSVWGWKKMSKITIEED